MNSSQKCILVVDDSNMVRYTVVQFIQSMGHRAVEAVDGTEVLPMVEEHRPDLVILDIHMPEKGGMEALTELRSNPRFEDLPVLVLTGAADAKVVRQAARLKVSGYLIKSDLSAGDIREWVGKILGESAESPARSRRVSRHFHILLAENNPLDQQLITGLLENWGCTVETAWNAQEVFLQLLDDEPFDLILMEETMPNVDGFAATAAIREQEQETGEHVPIVALTNQPAEMVRRRCREAGMDAYVTKPVVPNRLFKTIEGVVERASRPEGAVEESRTLFDWDELMERVEGDLELLRHMLEMYFRDAPLLLVEMR